MTFFKSITLAGLLAATTAIGAGAETWDMPTPYSDATFHTQNVRTFAEDVKEASDGALEITVHPTGSLFAHGEIPRAVRSGQVAAGEFLLSKLANDNPVYGIDSMPFLATSYDQARKLWEAQRPEVEKLLADQGMTVLYAVPWPPQGLYTKKEINEVSDLAGLKLRTYNATMEKLAAAVDAAPTQVETPDIAQAFTTGRVDAMLTSPSTGANSQAWDFVDYYTDVQGWLPKNVIVVSTEAFEALDEATQAAVTEAAARAEDRGWKMSMEENEAQRAVLTENGMNVVTPSDTLMTGLKEVGATMLTDWSEGAGESGKAVLDAYQQ